MRHLAYGWIVCAAVFARPISAADPDFSLLPSDTVAVLHVRTADLLKSDALKDYREFIAKAGADVIAAYEKRFTPAPSSVDQFTVFVRMSEKGEPLVLFRQTLAEPLAKAKFLTTSIPNAKEVKAKFGSYYIAAENDIAVALLDDKSILFGPPEAIASHFDRKNSAVSPLVDVLKENVAKNHLFLAANLEALPVEILAKFRQSREIPPPFLPLAQFSQVHLGMDFGTTGMLRVKIQYPNEAARVKADVALRDLAKVGRGELAKLKPEMMQKAIGDGKDAPLSQLPDATVGLLAVAAINYADEILADPPIKPIGNALTFETKIPALFQAYLGAAPLAVGMLLPAVQKVREAAERTKMQNNMKQIGLALHNYASAMGDFPPAAICDKVGKPLLSWRVAILPYIEQNNLYEQFKLDEPWDSEHNKKLIPVVVSVYRSDKQPTPVGETFIRSYTGKKAILDLPKSKGFNQIVDGLSNTMLAYESGESTIWTKPDMPVNDPKIPLLKLPTFRNGMVMVLLADGSVRMVKATLPEKTWRQLIDPSDGEVVNLED